MERIERAKRLARLLQAASDDNRAARDALNRYPRDLPTLATMGLGLPVLELPELSIHAAQRCLCALRGDSIGSVAPADRPLYGMLHIGPPASLIFLKSGLMPCVKNYVIAHELGHFLADVCAIEQLWRSAMPERTTAIRRLFAGQAPDALLELSALVRGLPGRPASVLGRDTRTADSVAESEIIADLIARELMAPFDTAADFIGGLGENDPLLAFQERFGLPSRVAIHYLRDIRHYLNPSADLFAALFAPLLHGENSAKNS